VNSLLKKDQKNSSAPVKINSRLFTFLVCVIVSIFFWLLMSLSKNYTISFEIPVQYKNMPQDKVVADYLPEKLQLRIQSKGFTLLLYKLKSWNDSLIIDLKHTKKYNSNNNYYVPLNSRQELISSQFSSNIQIVEINPDTLFFTFNKRISKKVPIKINQQITFKKEYQLTQNITCLPDSVEVYGSSEMINKIKQLETEPIIIKDIDKDVKLNVALKRPASIKFVEFSVTNVEAKIQVARYTESTLNIPIQIENLPDKYQLKIFPGKVEVKFRVSYDDYEKIKASDFIAVVDYNTIEKKNNKVKVKLVKSPGNIKNVKFTPQKVEYILRKDKIWKK